MELTILIIAVVAHLVIGIFTYLHNTKSYIHRFFLLFTIASVLWSIANYLSLNQQSTYATLNMVRWVMFFATFYSFTLFLTIQNFPSITLQLSYKKLAVLGALSTLVMILTRTEYVFSDINGVGRDATVSPGAAIPIFAATVGYFILSSIYTLFVRYRKANGVLRAQLQYLIVGVVGSALLIFITNFLLVVVFNINSMLILGPTYTLIFAGATTYAIIAHHLFDIRVIIKKTLVYSGLLLFAVGAYSMVVFFYAALFEGGIQSVLSARRFISDLLAAGVIAISIEPIRKRLVEATDKYLFVGEYDAKNVISELAQTLNNVLDIDEALQAMMKVITKALRVKNAVTFILTSEGDDKSSKTLVKRIQSVGYGSMAHLSLDEGDALIVAFLRKEHETVVLDDLREEIARNADKHPECQKLVKRLEALDAAVAIPLRVGDKLIGIFALGPKLSGDVFSMEDLQFLDIAAKQTASAIQKSRFYEDDQLKSEFVSIASHELLTPTAAIEGYLSMILDEKMAKVDPKAEEYLRKVQTSAKRLAELVADLLSVSRIESGKIVINKQPIEVSPTVKSAIDEIKVRADQAGMTLKYLAPEKPLPKVLADPERLAQIVVNLVSNAIKYNKPKGSIEVSMEADKKFVTFSVKDTGIGIAPEHQAHLFEKFYRVHDDSAAAEKVGTGLGLYITRNIIELQGGKIWLKSEQGKGSTFSFTLPVA